MTPTAYQDTFAADHLPPRDQWPELINVDQLGYPEWLNCAEELLDRAVAEGDGDRLVLRTPEYSWTYRDLAERANRIARVLVEDLGLKTGERVLLHAPNNPMLVACWFGIIKAGGIVVATMPMLRARELAVVIEKARIRLAFFDHRLAAEMVETRQRTALVEQALAYGNGELEAGMAAKPAEFAAVKTHGEDVCLIAFSSGTTGVPKGTMHFHRDVLAICDTFSQHVLKPRRDDVFIGSPPLAFTFGLGGLVLFPMRVRAATVLLEKAPPPELAKAIEQFRPTICFTSPTGYRFMLEHAPACNLSSLRQCVSAGETLPKATSDAWFAKTGQRIIDGIGATEMLHIFISASGDEIRPGATGKPVPGFEARVIDAEGREVPPDTIGRLAVRGPTGCRYLADERQKSYVLGGWNVTGDAYRMDADGYFWFQARTDDMIVSSGYNISGPEVEAALLEHPHVMECAVVGVPDAMRGMIVKAFVLLRAEAPAAGAALAEQLQVFVKAQIAPYKYPRAVEFVAALPRTESGKVQRFKLRQAAEAKATKGEAPRTN
ncbi:MAG: benzoate-CoA ligase family protein [Proteobacteria bacterium]|nr:benzoate-CoA ligase family protein [Pseudomonadota bacterium]